jgi:hypothetical protein
MQSRRNHNICTTPAPLKALANFCAQFLNEMEARMTLEQARRCAQALANRDGVTLTLRLGFPGDPAKSHTVCWQRQQPRDDCAWYFIETIEPEEATPCE